jgi:peptidoglycan pentaglycine glycine transferase (the first glycine)
VAAHVAERRGVAAHGVELVETTADAAQAWDQLAVHSPHGAALQSHAWGEFKRRMGWTVSRHRIEAEGRPVAVVSLQERALPGGRRLGRRLSWRIAYAPTGPVLLADGAPAARAALEGLAALARARRIGLLIVDPEWQLDSDEASALRVAGFRASSRQIQVARTGMLVPVLADEAAQRRLLNENTRRNINRATKAGVDVVRLDAHTPRDELAAAVDAAYTALVELGRRRGFVLRPRGYHTAANLTLIEAGAASIWLARFEGRTVAHTVVHHSGRRLLLHQAAEGEPGDNRLSANFLLQWTILRWAAAAGFEHYDLGGVDTHTAPGLPRDESHPLWNLYRFKAQWGARGVEFVGAHEHAPAAPLGLAIRAAWRASDRLRGPVLAGP